jgi:hypothetical protein
MGTYHPAHPNGPFNPTNKIGASKLRLDAGGDASVWSFAPVPA